MDKVDTQESEDWARYMANLMLALVQLYPSSVFESGYVLSLVRSRVFAMTLWMTGSEHDYGFVPFLGPM